MKLVVSLVAAVVLAGCAVKQGNITSVTQSVIGIDISQTSESPVPHVRLGYVRSQYHVVPTGTNQYAPAVISSMSLDNTFKHQVIDEDFATGGATRDLGDNTPAKRSSANRKK